MFVSPLNRQNGPSEIYVPSLRDNFLTFDNYNLQVRVQPEDRAAFGFVRSVNFVYLYESYSYAVPRSS